MDVDREVKVKKKEKRKLVRKRQQRGEKTLLIFYEKFRKARFCNTKETTNKDLVPSIWLIWELQKMSFILTILKKNDLIILPSVGTWQIQHSNDTDNEAKIQKIKGTDVKNSHTHLAYHLTSVLSDLPSITNLTPRFNLLKCYSVHSNMPITDWRSIHSNTSCVFSSILGVFHPKLSGCYQGRIQVGIHRYVLYLIYLSVLLTICFTGIHVFYIPF